MAEQGWWHQMMAWLGFRAAEQEQREQEQVVQGMGLTTPLTEEALGLSRYQQRYIQEPWERESAIDVNHVWGQAVDGEFRSVGETERALNGLYERTRDRVDGWVAEVERQWNAQHATEANWQEAWRSDYDMKDTPYDPDKAAHRDLYDTWQLSLGAQRERAVLTQAKEEGIVSPEAIRTYEQERSPFTPTLGHYQGMVAEAEATRPTLTGVYEQEKARVDGWMANAEREWDAVHRTEAQWQEAWSSDYDMKDTPYDPDNAGHKEKRDFWESEQDMRRDLAVMARAEDEGLVSHGVVDAFYTDAAAYAGQATSEDAPFPGTLGHYAGREAAALAYESEYDQSDGMEM